VRGDAKKIAAVFIEVLQAYRGVGRGLHQEKLRWSKILTSGEKRSSRAGKGGQHLLGGEILQGPAICGRSRTTKTGGGNGKGWNPKVHRGVKART